MIFLKHLQTLFARKGNRFIEKLVEIEVVLGEEVHGSCMETKPHYIVSQPEREDVEVKGTSNDPEINVGCTYFARVLPERLRVQTEGV